MRMREISLEGGLKPMMRARSAISALHGVVAAEPMPGRSALRVWRSEAVSDEALLSAAAKSGVRARIIR